MNWLLIFLSICSFQFYACKSQTHAEQIEQTSQEIIDAIEKLDTSTFISLIGRNKLRDISKTEEMVTFDVKKFKQFFDSSFVSARPKFIITDTYNSLGQQKVIIPIFRKMEAGSLKSLHLNLLFGPPDFVTLDKISGYSLIHNNSDSLDFMPLNYWKSGN